MEITIKLELGEKTLGFLASLAGHSAAVSANATTGVTKKAAAPAPVKKAEAPAAVEEEPVEEVLEEVPVVKSPVKPAPAKPAPAAPVKTPAKPAPAAPVKPSPVKPATPVKPAPAKPAAAAKPTAGQVLATPYEDLTEDADKLAHLMAHVTKHTKNGKSADVKALLTVYSVDRASELPVEYYDSFNEAISRYSAGESVADIFPDAE